MPLINQSSTSEGLPSLHNGAADHDDPNNPSRRVETNSNTTTTTTTMNGHDNTSSSSSDYHKMKQQHVSDKHQHAQVQQNGASNLLVSNGTSSSSSLSDNVVVNGQNTPSKSSHPVQNGCSNSSDSESSSPFVHLSSSEPHPMDGQTHTSTNNTETTDNSLTDNLGTPDNHHVPTATLPQSPSSPNHAQKVLTATNGVSEQLTPESPTTVRNSASQSPSRKHFRASRELELSIPLYYAGKNVFITGATGFIGKVFIEKLLRSCPDIGNIYCLIRPKNDQTIEDRLAALVDTKLFEGLRRDQPDFFSKLHPIHGDVLLPGLGLSQEDSQTLEENVNVVFHSAATVRFDEPLRIAVEMNVIAVRKMLNLSRKLQHLEAFVHVSTAYANCDISYIEEKVYPPTVEPQKIIDVLSWMDDEMVDLFTPKLLGDKPNTYTYTKQLAEHLLVTEGADLPLAIVRPSIVGAAWKEPFPGWIDNLNGPSGMYIAAGKGILRWMKADINAVADIVPVDIPVNIMVAVGWYTAVAKPGTVHIYHATAGSHNPFRWGEIGVAVNKCFKHIPLENCFRRPKVALSNNSFYTDYSKVVSHLCPAIVFDMALALIGRKPRMVKTYNKLHRSINALQFFSCNEWQWESTNLEILRHQLTPADLRMFYFDIRPLHWPTYIENYCLGAKKYVLNEDSSGLPAARAHLRNLRIIRTIFNSAIVVILWRVLIAKSQFARNLWFFIVSLVFKFVRFFRITSTMHK